MKALGYGTAALLFWLLHGGIRALAAVGSRTLLLAVPIASWCVHRCRRRPPPVPSQRLVDAAPVLPPPTTTDRAVASDAVDVSPAAASRNVDGADRIVSIQLDPPVGVLHLRLYRARRLVRPELVVTEPCLRTLLKARRHALPELTYEPLAGFEPIREQALAAAETLINALGNEEARRQRPARRKPLPADQRAIATSPTRAAAPALPSLDAAALAAPQPTFAAVAATRAAPGLTYVGRLVKAGTETVTPEGRPPYEIFEATLQLDNGAELALRGIELQRALGPHWVPGQRIAITSMGRVPVMLAQGGAGHKNLYQVRSLDQQ